MQVGQTTGVGLGVELRVGSAGVLVGGEAVSGEGVKPPG